MRTRRACSSAHGRKDPRSPRCPFLIRRKCGPASNICSPPISSRAGLSRKGLTIVRAARARHDGSRRNPWNDIECGSYYARSLSSYALLNAYSGLTFDQRIGEIGFKPARGGDAVYFWSAGRGWGEIEFRGATRDNSVKGGELAVSRLRLAVACPGRAAIDGRPALREGEVILLDGPRVLRAGDASSSERAGVAELELRGVRKSFQAVEVIHGRRPHGQVGLLHGLRRPFGMRKVDAAADDRGPRGRDRRARSCSTAYAASISCRRPAAWRWCSSHTRSIRI